LKRVYKRLKVDPKSIDPKFVSSQIDKAKNAYKDAEDIRDDLRADESIAHIVADLYEGYQQELRSANAMDFGDLLCNVVTLFKLEPKVLAAYRERFQHVLVDEYQDTNRVQYMLLRMLTSEDSDISVVGDDDQSIYAFRGATIENILNFKNDYPSAKVVTLATNYRSTKNILHAANNVIQHNRNRQEKVMVTDNSAGAPITAFQGYTEREEAEFVVQEILTELQQGKSLSDMAVFYRTNAQSRAIEEVLCETALSYEIYGGFRFYDRKEIKDILAYYRLLINPFDNEAFVRVINSPSRGIGAATVAKLATYASNEHLALMPALRQALVSSHALSKGAPGKKLKAFEELIAALEVDLRAAERSMLQGEDSPAEAINAIPDLLKAIGEKTEYIARLKKEDTAEAESRVENIYELNAVAQEFSMRASAEGRILSPSDFLDRTSLASDLDKDSDSTDAANQRGTLSLMTLHLAKGLEFDTVFMIGMEEGVLPHSRSLDDPFELEEERRLCYVGITRARKRLCLSRCLTRQSFGRYGWHTGEASRFLYDIPTDVIEEKGGY
jgi:DNA helicase-2/ATP-dependent DNA helicase PcrA